ncbi:hypothetical protein BDV19DRAFT_387178 [Aspergillus venezuelensis]
MTKLLIRNIIIPPSSRFSQYRIPTISSTKALPAIMECIGLAGNIITFIDAGLTIASIIKDIRRTTSGATAEYERLKRALSQFKAETRQLDKYKPSTGSGSGLKEERCAQARSGLQDSRGRAPDTCHKTSRTHYKLQMVDFYRGNRNVRRRTDRTIAKWDRSMILDRLASIKKSSPANKRELTALKDSMKALRGACNATGFSQQTTDIIRDMFERYIRATDRVRQSRVLKGLRFEGMNDRFEAMRSPHSDNLDWLIDELKNMADHRLNKWATRDGKTLFKGRFYCWKPGSDMQNSRKGLVKGLLQSIADNSPGLIPTLFPNEWNASMGDPDIFFDSADNLETAYHSLRSLDIFYEKHKFAIFRDALDEYGSDEYGKETIDLMRELTEWNAKHQDNVKICVSSRLNTDFLRHFDGYPELRLHDVNREAIEQTVSTTLRGNTDLVNLARNCPERIKNFISTVTSKSEGVFLWTTYVLRHLERGLRKGDSLDELDAKVEKLPTEMDDLFFNLLTSIDSDYQEEAYALLQVAAICPNRWPIFRFSFVGDYPKDSDFASKLQGPMSKEGIEDRLQRIERRITEACNDLLVVEKTKADRYYRAQHGLTTQRHVLLTHRSIIEFLQDDRTRHQMLSRLKNFDPHKAICHTLLAHIKSEVTKNCDTGMGHMYCMPGLPCDLSRPTCFEWDIYSILRIFRNQGQPVPGHIVEFLCTASDAVSEAYTAVTKPPHPPDSGPFGAQPTQ